MVTVLMGWLATLLATSALDVRGSSTCPAPADVSERVAALLSPGAGLGFGRFVQIDRVAGSPVIDRGAGGDAQPSAGEAAPVVVDVQLHANDSGGPLATRRLSSAGSCQGLAESAAVVIAVWAGQYETAELGRGPAGEADSAGDKPGLHAASGPPSQEAPPRTWSLGAGAWLTGASDGRGGFAPLIGPELTFSSRSRRWFGRVFAGISGERQLAIDAGAASWRRIVLAPSMGARWGRKLFLEAGGGPVVGPIFVRGVGFSPNESNWAIDAGLFASARVGIGFGKDLPFSAWIAASGMTWMRPHALSVAMSPRGTQLPRNDLLLGLGIDWRFDR
ncbi:MAG TPA: hypothetical protein VHU40_19975 [Polyangia bacterium]|nr:hypothetical protein [Polyangia bacterium]